MAMQGYALAAARIGKFKGKILKRAIPREILARTGRQEPLPRNNSDTYVARRWLPYGATSTDANSINRFIQPGAGDRTNVIVQAHQTTEGVTPPPDNIVPQDITVVMQQYSCLYGFTDKTYKFYEDDIPGQMAKQVADRMVLVNEYIIYGALRGSTNYYYGGTGTSRSTVNGPLTLPMLRKVATSLVGNHAMPVTKMLKASPNFGTSAVFDAFNVYVPYQLEGDVRDLPNFTPVEQYSDSSQAQPNEIGKAERFRFIIHPDLVAIQDSGASVASTASQYVSTTGTSIDVFQPIVIAEDAFSQITLRGEDSSKPVLLLPEEASKADPLGQRGYSGASWWKAVMVENPGWMAVLNVAMRVQQ
jgi:N4-gp56 family major capsid protein